MGTDRVLYFVHQFGVSELSCLFNVLKSLVRLDMSAFRSLLGILELLAHFLDSLVHFSVSLAEFSVSFFLLGVAGLYRSYGKQHYCLLVVDALLPNKILNRGIFVLVVKGGHR